MNVPVRLTRIGAVLLAAGLLAVVFVAGQHGVAAVVAQQPRYQFEGWRSGKFSPDAAGLSAMEAELQRALALDPANPALLEDLGRFYAARVERGHSYDSQVRASRRQSLNYFRRSLELRPTSGQNWLSVASMKLSLGERDDEFSAALQQALQRTPWEPQVQLAAIELALDGWQNLSQAVQNAVKQAIRAQAQWRLVDQKPALLALFKRYQKPEFGCLLEADPNACSAS